MNGTLPEEAYAVALASNSGVGPASLRTLLTDDPPSVVWSRSGQVGDVARIWQRHEEQEISVALRGGVGYPERLVGVPLAPTLLFALGDPTVVDHFPTVAIVGSRSPTRYGIGVAAQLGAELAALGVSVVSGLALGIDGAAHEGACAAGAPPIAVVAGGLDDPYPRCHARLWTKVAERGAVFSENPVGVATEKWRFPVRNRLLASLSDVVVVVESREHGGALHTVSAAAELGIPVGAVPGSIRSPMSVGTNAVLSEGGFVVRDVGDIVTALSLIGVHLNVSWAAGASGPAAPPALPGAGADQSLLDQLSAYPTSLDELVRSTGLGLAQLCGGLERLARAGLARDTGGWWERA
jgi:DNA processing protein